MKFALTELFKVAANPFKDHTSASTNAFVAPVKAKVVGVTEPSLIQKWLTPRVIDPSKNPLANMALGLVTEKLIDTVIPFLARGLWKFVTILPGKVKFAVSGTLATVTGLNYVLRALLPTGLLSSLTEFSQTVKATVESLQQTLSQSVALSNTVKNLANTVKTYAAEKSIEPVKRKEIGIPAVPTETAVVEEAAKAVVEAAPSHSWWYYAGLTTAVLITGGTVYYFGMTYFYGSTSRVHILTPPGKGGVSFGYVQQQDPYPFYEQLNSIAHVFDHGVGYIVAGLSALGIPALAYFRHDKTPNANVIRTAEPVENHPLTDARFPNPQSQSGIVELPQEMQNATPSQKSQFLQSLVKNKKEIQLEKSILEPSSPPKHVTSEHDSFIQKSLKQLTPEQVEAITASPKYDEILDSSSEVVQSAFTEILTSPDRWEAIGRLFGAN